MKTKKTEKGKTDKIKTKLSEADLISLLNYNCQKMNFQQEMCFQFRNWAIVIMVGFLTIIWTNEITPETFWYHFGLHFVAILTILILLYFDSRWHEYFFHFRDREILLEDLIFRNCTNRHFQTEYYKSLSIGGINKAGKITNLKNALYEHLELFLVGFISISLIFRIIIHIFNLYGKLVKTGYHLSIIN
jgi:hypothetical protein